MATTCLLLVLTLLSQVGGDGNPYTTQGGDPVLDPCIVKVQDEVRIPAQEAGVLIQMSVREGSRVGKGELLAVIDDREAKMALRVAEYGSEAAKKRAMDKIEERYASKAAEFAKLDWERAVQANEETPNAVPDIEVRQKKLGWQRSDLQIEKAQKTANLPSWISEPRKRRSMPPKWHSKCDRSTPPSMAKWSTPTENNPSGSIRAILFSSWFDSMRSMSKAMPMPKSLIEKN